MLLFISLKKRNHGKSDKELVWGINKQKWNGIFELVYGLVRNISNSL